MHDCCALGSSSGVPNDFVELSFDMVLKIVTCSFLHKQDTSTKHCSIMYGFPGKTCRTLGHQSSSNTSSHVQIGLPIDYQPQNKHCFRVTASNDTFTVIVEGSFTTQLSSKSTKIRILAGSNSVFVYTGDSGAKFTNNESLLGFSVGVMGLIIVIIIIAYIVTTVILIKLKRSLQASLNNLKAKGNEQRAIYEKLDYQSVKSVSPSTIDTGENAAYSSALSESKKL